MEEYNDCDPDQFDQLFDQPGGDGFDQVFDQEAGGDGFDQFFDQDTSGDSFDQVFDQDGRGDGFDQFFGQTDNFESTGWAEDTASSSEWETDLTD